MSYTHGHRAVFEYCWRLLSGYVVFLCCKFMHISSGNQNVKCFFLGPANSINKLLNLKQWVQFWNNTLLLGFLSIIWIVNVIISSVNMWCPHASHIILYQSPLKFKNSFILMLKLKINKKNKTSKMQVGVLASGIRRAACHHRGSFSVIIKGYYSKLVQYVVLLCLDALQNAKLWSYIHTWIL